MKKFTFYRKKELVRGLLTMDTGAKNVLRPKLVKNPKVGSNVKVSSSSSKQEKAIQSLKPMQFGSISMFTFEGLIQKLKLNGKSLKICLLTMSSKKAVSTYIVSGLEVSQYTGARYHNLLEVFSRSVRV